MNYRSRVPAFICRYLYPSVYLYICKIICKSSVRADLILWPCIFTSMYVLQTAKQDALKLLKAALGKAYTPSVSDLEVPPDVSMGNIAFPCFGIAKGLKRNPAELATEIAAKVAPKGLILRIEAQGPYVNFWIDSGRLAERVLKEVATARERYGFSVFGKGKRVLVEYANLNTHKEVHVGHMRNMALGQAIANIASAVGYEVVPHAYINDLGNAVARCLWGYQKFHTKEKPEKGEENAFFGEVYAEATKAMEEDAGAREEISEIQRQLEGGKGEWVKLWKVTNRWSLDGLKAVFDDFGLELQKIYLESDVLKSSKKIVQALIKKGIAVHSEGAWVVRLEDEGLGVSILVKSDGTHLYNAKDLGLAQKKEEDYHADRSIYVVDARQKQVMAQLFATLKRMGFKKELEHLSYGHVSLPEGAMSSRMGTIIRYQDMMGELREEAAVETRGRHEDWDEAQVNNVARAIAFAAVKFFMLRSDPDKDIIFNVKESLSFEGFSGPYLLYTIARCKRLLEKSDGKHTSERLRLPSKEAEAVIRALAAFPECVAKTAADYQVSRVAQSLFDLAQAFSTFYALVPVNAQLDETIRRSYLALVSAVAQTIENGLRLLGIEPVDEM